MLVLLAELWISPAKGTFMRTTEIMNAIKNLFDIMSVDVLGAMIPEDISMCGLREEEGWWE